MRDTLIRFFATGCFVGYFPLIPGTVGSLLALLIVFIFAPWIGAHRHAFFIVLLFLFTPLSIWIADRAETLFGRKDPGPIVIDEIIGYGYAILLVPLSLGWLLAAFFLFRAFDVLKPFPLRRSQKLKGGLGIVIDDVGAGLYTTLLLTIVHFLLTLFW